MASHLSRGVCAAAAVVGFLAAPRAAPAAHDVFVGRVVCVRAAAGYAYDVATCGSYVCLAAGAGGLLIYDASVPTNPVPVGSWPAAYPEETRAVACSAGRAWLAQWGRLGCPWRSRVDVVSLTDPAAPACVASASIESALAWSVACDGARAAVGLFGNVDVKYGIAANSSVRVFEIGAYPGLRIVGSGTGLAFARGVALRDAEVYAADLYAGVRGWTEICPTGAPPVLRYAHPDFTNGTRAVFDIATGNGAVFAACGRDGIESLDLADPDGPRLLGAFDTQGDARGVSVSSNLAVVADGERGVVLLDISDPRAPARLAEVATPGVAEAACLASNAIYVADGPAGLVTIELTRTPRALFREQPLLLKVARR